MHGKQGSTYRNHSVWIQITSFKSLAESLLGKEIIKTLFSDNDSIFISCENELKKVYEEVENRKI